MRGHRSCKPIGDIVLVLICVEGTGYRVENSTTFNVKHINSRRKGIYKYVSHYYRWRRWRWSRRHREAALGLLGRTPTGAAQGLAGSGPPAASRASRAGRGRRRGVLPLEGSSASLDIAGDRAAESAEAGQVGSDASSIQHNFPQLHIMPRALFWGRRSSTAQESEISVASDGEGSPRGAAV